MRNKHLFTLLGFFLALMLSVSGFTQDNFRVALVDFMYVPEGMGGEYVAMEKEIAQPVHQELVNTDQMEWWGLYRIPYPGGTNAEYHFATVRIYNSPQQLENAGQFGPALRKVHGGKDMDKIGETIMKTRDLVKTHRLFSWERFMAEDLTAPPATIQVVYFKTSMDKWEQYTKMETEIYHPMHKKEIEMGKRAGWEGWFLQAPMGSSQAYTHVAVDAYKDWQQYMAPKDGEAILKEVHPDKSFADLDKIFMKTVDLVNIEEWNLVSFTTPKQ